MTMIDVIDQVLRDLGASESSIAEARTHSIATQIPTKSDKELAFRQLTDQEANNYRGMVVLIITSVASNPTLMKQLLDEFKENMKKN